MKAKLLHAEGQTEEALEILSRLPAFYSQQITEQLFSKDTKEYRFWNRRNFYGNMDVMAIKLARTFLYDNTLSLEEKLEKTERAAAEFSRLSEKEDLSCFCVAEEAVYSALLGYLAYCGGKTDHMVRIAEKQFFAMTKMTKLSQTDPVLKDCMEKTYGTDDLAGLIIKHWDENLSKAYPDLKENTKFRAILDEWKGSNK